VHSILQRWPARASLFKTDAKRTETRTTNPGGQVADSLLGSENGAPPQVGELPCRYVRGRGGGVRRSGGSSLTERQKKVAQAVGTQKNTIAGDRTFLPAGFPTLTSLASVTGAFLCTQAPGDDAGRWGSIDAVTLPPCLQAWDGGLWPWGAAGGSAPRTNCARHRCHGTIALREALPG
jgi:hypothetical protein